jgi:hypothetical protein
MSQIDFGPVLCMVVLLMVLVVLLLAVGRRGGAGQGGPGPEAGPYEGPTIRAGKYKPGCSGGYVSTQSHYFGNSSRRAYGLPGVPDHAPEVEVGTEQPVETPSLPANLPVPEIGVDLPIPAPNWPVKVVKK